jgi:hypothetical protein
MTAELHGIGAGSAESPVRGSGVFVGGHGDWDGHGAAADVRDRCARLHVYDRSLDHASFDSVATNWDGSIGVHVSRRVNASRGAINSPLVDGSGQQQPSAPLRMLAAH